MRRIVLHVVYLPRVRLVAGDAPLAPSRGLVTPGSLVVALHEIERFPRALAVRLPAGMVAGFGGEGRLLQEVQRPPGGTVQGFCLVRAFRETVPPVEGPHLLVPHETVQPLAGEFRT